MNKNEIRGYIFMVFALLCLCTCAMGGGYFLDNVTFNILNFLIFLFTCIAVVFFVRAYEETKGLQFVTVDTSMKQRVGQGWNESNIFMLKLDKVNVEQLDDNTQRLCNLHMVVENW